MAIKITAKTPRGAAKQYYAGVVKYAKRTGCGTEGIYLWSPEETKRRGWGSGWTVCWEEGPFDWTMEATGWYDRSLSIPEDSRDTILAEPYNGFILGFY